MKDEALSALTQKHGAAKIVNAVNEAMEVSAAEVGGVPRMTVRALYDLTSRGFRPEYGIWLLAGLVRLGYTAHDAAEAFPKLKPFVTVAQQVRK